MTFAQAGGSFARLQTGVAGRKAALSAAARDVVEAAARAVTALHAAAPPPPASRRRLLANADTTALTATLSAPKVCGNDTATVNLAIALNGTAVGEALTVTSTPLNATELGCDSSVTMAANNASATYKCTKVPAGEHTFSVQGKSARARTRAVLSLRCRYHTAANCFQSVKYDVILLTSRHPPPLPVSHPICTQPALRMQPRSPWTFNATRS